MSRLSRLTQTLFGSSAGLNQITQFGSFAAGSTTYITDASGVQGGNFLDGWFSAVLADNAPCIEDMNALFLLTFFQIAYLMQAGIPEWDSATTYYTGSIVSDGAGLIYCSLANANINHAVTDATRWQLIGGTILQHLGDLTYGGATGGMTRLSGNTTTTKKYLTQTGNGSISAAPQWSALSNPTIQRFTSGSGTYTTPAGVARIKVTVVGGGGGGANGGTASGSGGSNGGDSTFGPGITAAGGAVGQYGGPGGSGGTVSDSISSGDTIAVAGGDGMGNAFQCGSTSVNMTYAGGAGGANPMGGAGAVAPGASGSNAKANTGAGGGGGGASSSNSNSTSGGGGGGAGGHIVAFINSPAATYSYGVGAGGSGMTGGTNGGNGAAGIIIVEEFYQ